MMCLHPPTTSPDCASWCQWPTARLAPTRTRPLYPAEPAIRDRRRQANVNLLSRLDLDNLRLLNPCQMFLEGEVDRAEVVLVNSIRSCEFWSVRVPTPELSLT